MGRRKDESTPHPNRKYPFEELKKPKQNEDGSFTYSSFIVKGVNDSFRCTVSMWVARARKNRYYPGVLQCVNIYNDKTGKRIGIKVIRKK